MPPFEAAADAIAAGDAETLQRLLHDDPSLVRERSPRPHRSTLLHYVAANGVEDSRQRTPGNIVEITDILLDAGAEINAESEAYGGGSTALALAATSCHPERAGVQLALLQRLIDRGATLDGPDGRSTVNACLRNGRGQAAVFLAERGASLDLEGAAGVGRLDLVRSSFDESGALTPTATRQQMLDAFAWACEFGRTEIVAYLLDRGVDPAQRVQHHGQTGLHWAASGGHADVASLLLLRGAPVDAKDETFGGTPLGWAIYAWRNEPGTTPPQRYYDVARLLVHAGAVAEPDWFTDAQILADPVMRAILNG